MDVSRLPFQTRFTRLCAQFFSFFFAFIHTDISSKYICLFYSRLLDDFVTEFLSFSFCMVRLLCSHISFLDESVFFFRFFCMEIRLNFTYTELNIQSLKENSEIPYAINLWKLTVILVRVSCWSKNKFNGIYAVMKRSVLHEARKLDEYSNKIRSNTIAL